MSKEFEIVEMVVDLVFEIKGSLLPNVIEGKLFYYSMLCKWTTSLANMIHLSMNTKFDVNIGCVMSLKGTHVKENIAKLFFLFSFFHYRIPTIQVG